MKKANEYTQRDVRRRAYAILYSANMVLLNHTLRRFKLDMRYNFNKEVAAFIKANALSDSDKDKIRQIRRRRSQNKPPQFVSIWAYPIVKDYINNVKNKSGYLRSVSAKGLHFWCGRNHWAKNDKDLRILAILQKTYKN